MQLAKNKFHTFVENLQCLRSALDPSTLPPIKPILIMTSLKMKIQEMTSTLCAYKHIFTVLSYLKTQVLTVF